ncbi:MAG: DNA polymerase III subunit beta [Christensenellales bacterium]|jgi:DNA polymerase-3 subunit beta
MRFTCSVPDLLNGLTVATRALSSRTPKAILEGVLLRAEYNSVTLTCSDGDLSIVTKFPADVRVEGGAVLPGKLFLDVARKMPQLQTVLVEETDKKTVVVKCPGVRMTIAAQNSEEYPALPQVNGREQIAIDKEDFKSLIDRTSFAVAVNDSREVLNGCLLDIRDDCATMVGMDGFRMAIAKCAAQNPNVTLSAIIHGRVLGEISKILSDGKSEEKALLQIAGTQMALIMGETKLFSSLISGQYISYAQILPKNFATRARVRREAFLDAVNRVSLMAESGKTSLVKLSFGQDRMIITANSESGDAYEEVPIELEGADLDIAFNVRFLTDLSHALEEEEILMSLNTPVSPCLLLPPEGDDSSYLVLPVRIGL